MSYKELIVWQKAMVLVERVYQLMRAFPVAERFRLCDQLSRAVVSIPSNIAEGYGRPMLISLITKLRGVSK